MSDYTVSRILPTDKRAVRQMDALLEKEGIERDKTSITASDCSMIITILWQPDPVLPTHCAVWLFLPSIREKA